jgi:hypothetical protein
LGLLSSPKFRLLMPLQGKSPTREERIEAIGAILVGLLFGSHDTLSRAYNAIVWNLVNNPGTV